MNTENKHSADSMSPEEVDVGLTLKAGRALDARVAEEVFGHAVVQQKRMVYEQTAKGSRPLAPYSSEMEFAWEVARKMHISVLPIEGDSWFAIVGRGDGWKSPADFIAFLQEGNFVNAGAAIGQSAAHTICLAAVNAVRNLRLRAETDGAAPRLDS